MPDDYDPFITVVKSRLNPYPCHKKEKGSSNNKINQGNNLEVVSEEITITILVEIVLIIMQEEVLADMEEVLFTNYATGLIVLLYNVLFGSVIIFKPIPMLEITHRTTNSVPS